MGIVTPLQERPSELIGGLLRELAEEARRTRFEVAPNPCVGAAVVAGSEVIGRGHHRVWGGPHAEVEAIEAARKSGVPESEWDLIVVTLEPCSSRGKTGPCVEAILATGVRHVVVGAIDPDLRHGGRGIEALRDAGIEVEFFACRPEARGSWALEAVSPHFVRWTSHERLRRPRPWVVAKWAQTKSGQLSPPEDVGDGRWISGPASQAEVQVLRGRVDAIVTGIGTVKTDDPRLSVRAPGDASAPPLRVVLDSYLITDPRARLLRPLNSVDAVVGREAAGPVLIYCLPGPDAGRHRALTAAGAEVVTLPHDDDGRLSLWSVADDLWERGCRRTLLEAGPTLIQSYEDAGLIDQYRIYSGDVVGGRGASLAPLIGELVGGYRGRTDKGQRLDRESGSDVVLELFR
ncbi:MAG: bifunctional diaminohydroxyphosphoribosylaminopyrimidine deaminase/5-amino-6-(5-phosphoribosylamino)uracil reductase RibD [Planctomycetota bacterium]|nr:bifunctional diaminohydroxyphosphoribosylaminopyrimidine deaminase/5-amino-6-(5-phosphoribosylamino)uracil reductase RibD [Planctomycetota bacterium]